jgi:hypothetical protein
MMCDWLRHLFSLCVGELFWVAQMRRYNFGFGSFSINKPALYGC